MINQELLELLACPRCKKSVELSKDQRSLICRQCGLAFEISEDIPVMLIDKARPISPESE